MKRLIIFIALFLAGIGCHINAQELSLNQIEEAACRVNAGNAYGSGTAIHDDGSYIYVLTNAHVVGSSSNVKLEFFRYGRKTIPLSAQVYKKYYSDRSDIDFAICRLNKSVFGDYPPRIIPLAPSDFSFNRNDYISSAGCPEARWLQLWNGFILENQTSRVTFTPAPLGGQSGSGIFTHINGKTYLAAILTWKMGGGGRDSRGFDVGYGGAIPISTLRKLINNETVQPTQIPISWKHIQYNKIMYSLGDDGKYYPQDSKGYASVPAGVRILRRNIDCDNFRRPRPSPESPDNSPNNPFGDFPPGFGDDEPPKPTPEPNKPEEPPKENPEIAALKLEIIRLQAEIDRLTLALKTCNDHFNESENKYKVLLEEKNALQLSLSNELEKTAELRKELEDTKILDAKNFEKIKALESELFDKSKSLINLQQDIDSKQEKINSHIAELNTVAYEKSKLEEILNSKNTVLEEKTKELTSVNTELSTTKTQRNWGFGGAGILGALAGAFGWMVWNRKGRDKIQTTLDSTREKIVDNLPSQTIEGMIRDRMDKIEEKILGKNHLFEKQMDVIQDYIDSKLAEVMKKKAETTNINELLDNFEKKVMNLLESKIQEKRPLRRLKKKRGLPTRIVNKNINITPDIQTNIPQKEKAVYTEPDIKEQTKPEPQKEQVSTTQNADINQPYTQVSERIRQFFALKQKDGESVEQWALYAVLYKEAMVKLRNGEFSLKTFDGEQKLYGQKQIADKIDNYVQQQFLARLTIQNLNSEKTLHDAMIGFLYKEAVDLLRKGQFNVLGAADVADAIEAWVRLEFIRRLGLSF